MRNSCSCQSYHLMASDALAVMDLAGIEEAALVGWSDGACTSLVLADQQPDRVCGVFSSPATWTPVAPRNSR